MLEVGARVGDWIVECPLGAAGVGSVYRVHAESDPSRIAALKLLHPADRPTGDRLARLGTALAGVRHPGLVAVLEIRAEAEPPHLVTALVDGEKLSTKVREVGPLPAVEALKLFEGLTSAVAALHAVGLHHGDLKPQNVFVAGGRTPLVVDLGLGVDAAEAPRAPRAPRVDTVSYVPPEWSSEVAIDGARWDVYALGTLFWEVLVGRRAFPLPDDSDPEAAALQVMAEKEAHPPLDPGPDTPFFLRVLIRDMTHPEPAQRPSTAADVLTRLQAGEAGSLLDPIELFRTPMPTWKVEEAATTPTGGGPDHMSSSMVPASPVDMQGAEPVWWRSFASGAIAGGFVVALVFVAALGWALGSGWIPFAEQTVVVPVPTP